MIEHLPGVKPRHPLTESALHYFINLGWLPIWVMPDSGATYRYANGDGTYRYLDTAEKIEAEFDSQPADRRLAILTGERSGNVVIDVDHKDGTKNGRANFQALIADREWPDTLTAETATGGWHFIFQHPGPDYYVKSTASVLAEDIDVKGDGGLIKVAPTVGYKWRNPECAPAPMPDWLLELVATRKGSEAPMPAPTVEQSPEDLRRAVERAKIYLSHLDPNAGYDDWWKPGAAIHQMTGGDPAGFAAWDAWSAKGKDYKSRETRAKWSSFRANKAGGVTEGYLRSRAPFATFSINEAQLNDNAAPPMTLPDSVKWVTDDDLVAQYAFCPSRSRQVVPLVTDDANAGMTFDNFKKDHARWNIDKKNPADVWLHRVDRLSVAGLQMRPDRKRPTFSDRGETFVNTYRPPDHSAPGGDATMAFRYFEHLLPTEAEREWFLDWLAHKMRKPEIPGAGVIMVAHGTQGTGRGTLGNRLLPALFGERYVAKPDMSDLTDKSGQGQYNDFVADALVVVVDETDTNEAAGRSRYGKRKDAYRALQKLVEPAPRYLRVKRKYGSAGDEMTNASYIIATNDRDAVALDPDDRRFAVLTNGYRMPVEFRFEFHAWLDHPRNVAAFARYLLTERDISHYSPFADPPLFVGKADMVEMGKSDIDRAVDEAIAAMPTGLFTVQQIAAWIALHQPFREWRFPEDSESIIVRAVQRAGHRVGVRNGKNHTIAYGGKTKVAVYALSVQMATHWKTRDRLREEVMKNDAELRIVSSNVVQMKSPSLPAA